MKKEEVVIGGVYSNGKKGRFYSERKVLDISREGKYKLYEGQANQETVLYEVINGNKCSKIGQMTLLSFASWAKERIS